MTDDELVDAHVAAVALGWTVGRLRVWRYRNPGALEIVAKGKHGVALFRWGDVRHAHEVVERARHVA